VPGKTADHKIAVTRKISRGFFVFPAAGFTEPDRICEVMERDDGFNAASS